MMSEEVETVREREREREKSDCTSRIVVMVVGIGQETTATERDDASFGFYYPVVESSCNLGWSSESQPLVVVSGSSDFRCVCQYSWG